MHDSAPPPFTPIAPAHPGIVSWIHLGDLHMLRPGEQNYRDLAAIIGQINRTYAAQDISFVYLPGDIADDGSAPAYNAVRQCLDKLQLPWCAIVGDHDVHQRSFTNFQQNISPSLYTAFTVGNIRFLRLNAFSEPRPDAFSIDQQQLDWLERELQSNTTQRAVVLLHCYPTDLKQGGLRLTQLLHQHRVLLVDMGHTHYNEISNDGHTLYTATRSTGQIEEGPVGFSVLTLDGDTLSWHFVPLGAPALASITYPSDERLLTTSGAAPLTPAQPTPVRVKIWSQHPVQTATLQAFGTTLPLARQDDTLWSGELPGSQLTPGIHELSVQATDTAGNTVNDCIHIAVGITPPQNRSPKDQDNAIGAWPERHILGTQLGPNKNGKKW